MEHGRTMTWKPTLGMKGGASQSSADVLPEDTMGVQAAEGEVWPLLHTDVPEVNSAANGLRLLREPEAAGLCSPQTALGRGEVQSTLIMKLCASLGCPCRKRHSGGQLHNTTMQLSTVVQHIAVEYRLCSFKYAGRLQTAAAPKKCPSTRVVSFVRCSRGQAQRPGHGKARKQAECRLVDGCIPSDEA